MYDIDTRKELKSAKLRASFGIVAIFILCGIAYMLTLKLPFFREKVTRYSLIAMGVAMIVPIPLVIFL